MSRNHEFGLDNSYGTCLSSHFTCMDTGVVILCSFPFLMFPWSFWKPKMVEPSGIHDPNSRSLSINCLTSCVLWWLVFQVYKRSRDICLQLYQKEIFTETSYLSLYGYSSYPCGSGENEMADTSTGLLANWFFSLCLFGYVLKKVLALECSLEDKGLQPNQMAVLAVRTCHLALSKLHLIFNFIC